MTELIKALPIIDRLIADCRGNVAIVTALAAAMLMGFAGLAVDVGFWLMNQRNMQGAAEQAAYSAAIAAGAGGGANGTTQAKGTSASMGFIDGQSGVAVAVNNPPSQGSYTSNASAWEVIISQPQPLWFTGVFRSTQPTASARAVAVAGSTSDLCVLALDPTASSSASTSGSASMNLACGLADNSTSTSGLSLTGSSKIWATSVTLVGSSYNQASAAHLYSSNIQKSQPATADPYASRTVPTYGSCDHTSFVASTTQTISPGVYCNGFGVGSGANLTLNPGVYIVVGGTLNITSSATITGTDVTFVLTGNSNGYAAYTTVSISGGATISLAAPTSGSMSGLVFFQDRNAPASGVNSITGGDRQLITGALYFPNQTLSYTGNSSLNGVGQCTQLIARILTFTGNSSVKLSCSGAGVSSIGGSQSAMLE